MLNVNTFSIVARDPATGAVGAAAATKLPAVGAFVPRVAAGVCAVVTQAWTNPLLAVDVVAFLSGGLPADAALERALATDPHPEQRQIAVVPAVGGIVAHTGAEASPWKGHLIGTDYAVAGNLLAGPATLEAMATGFEEAGPCPLPDRLLIALTAGLGAGGDRRGVRSAALVTATTEPYPHLDLRVDDHDHPVEELRRIHDLAGEQLLPFIEALPTRRRPGGRFDLERMDAVLPEPDD